MRAATKTARSTRRVPLPAECVTALRARRAQQHADRLARGDKWTTTDLVFTTPNGTPIEPRNLNRAFETLSRRDPESARRHPSGALPRSSAHLASLLHEQGADARTIMEVLGHSSIRVTMDVYTFVRLDTQRAAFDRVSDALAGIDGTGRTAMRHGWSNRRGLAAVAVNHHRQRKSQRPCRSLDRASGLLCTRQDSNLQPSDP
ncbi:tyrosine-type recombinase/integrase [Streptomyces sp. NPDC005407]|uniref:tyrosine-type recombinase/integrase n=1 Tax=Streptomyces sp. NPDC005407 TaxID=3155340 RepID=UPI0033AB5D6D